MQAYYMAMVGILATVTGWLMVTMTALFAERVAFKTKVEYFRKCLEKDAAFYDENVPTAMASRISKETAAIQRGLGEKVAMTFMSIVGFVLSFILGFYLGWLFACILLAGVPFLMIVGSFMGDAMEDGMVEAMKSYS